ncbi:hypothetical protein [Desulfocicer niacini]
MENFNITKICNFFRAGRLKCLPFIPIHQWKIWSGVIQLGMLLSMTAVLSMGFMYFVNMFWELYAYTPMGQQFLEMYPGVSLAVSDLLDLDVVTFSTEVTVSTFLFCLFISAVCQMVYLLRYFYLPRGLFGRFILFGMPLASVLARYLQDSYELEYWNIAFAVALFPTLILFSGCFRFSHEHIPEIGDIITDVSDIVRKLFKFIKNESHLKQ